MYFIRADHLVTDQRQELAAQPERVLCGGKKKQYFSISFSFYSTITKQNVKPKLRRFQQKSTAIHVHV